MRRIIPQLFRNPMLVGPLRKLNFGASVWLIVCLHLALTCFLAWQLNIRIDEAFSLHTSSSGPGFAFQQALRFELQPPLYFVGLSVWRVASGEIFWARLLSVFCAALAIPATVALARRLLPRVAPAAVAAAVAFNPFVVVVAVDIRLYAFALLLSVLLLLFFWDGYVANDGRREARWVYVMLSVAALYTQYYMGFLLLANGMVLVALRRWRECWRYAIGMCIVLMCFSPMFTVVTSQVAAHTQTITTPAAPVFQRVREMYWHVSEYILPASPSFPRLSTWFWRLLVLAGAVVTLWKWRLLARGRHAVLFTLVAVLVGSFVWVHGVVSGTLTSPRHTVALFVPCVLLAFAIVDVLDSEKLRRLWVATIVLLGLASIGTTYTPMAKNGDWKRVAGYVMAGEKPGQPIVTFSAACALLLRHYYAGPNRIVPLPAEQNFATYNIRDYALDSEQSVQSLLSAAHTDTSDLWLVTSDVTRFLDVDRHPEFLERVIERCYSVVSDQLFFESRVRFLRKLAVCPPGAVER